MTDHQPTRQPLIPTWKLITESWNAFTSTWETTVKYAALFLIPIILMALPNLLSPLIGVALMLLLTFILSIVAIIIGIMTSIWMFVIILKLEDKQSTTMDLPAIARQLFWPFIGASILVALVMFGTLLPGIISLLVFSILSTIMGTAKTASPGLIGTLLFIASIVVMTYLGLRLSFTQLAVIDDNKRSTSSLKFSWFITTKRFWSIVWRQIVVSIIFGIPMVLILIFAFIVIGFISGTDLLTALGNSDGYDPSLAFVANLVQGIVQLAFIPLMYIYQVKLYRSLKTTA